LINFGQAIIKSSLSEHAAADVAAFRECVRLFDALCELQAKIAPRPVPETVWRDFMGLSPQRRRAIIEQLRHYTAILSAASKDGISLIGEKRLAWFAMRLLKLVPPSGFLDLIGDGDYFEIYNADGLQIFRNLEFYLWPGWLVPLRDQNHRVVAVFGTSKRKRLYM